MSVPFRFPHALRPLATATATAFFGLVVATPAAMAQDGAPSTPRLAAESPHTWELVVSPYTLHWHQDEDHRRVGLVGLERHDATDHSLWGLSLFSNSFGQPSAYAYYGHEWNGLAGRDALYAKLSAGIIYGYKGQYEDKIPLNHRGFAPAIIPAVGWRLTPNDAVQAMVLGTAGLMFSYNRRF